MNDLINRVGGYREYAPTGAQRDWLEARWIHVAPPLGTEAAPESREHLVVSDVAPSLCFECRRDAAGRPTEGRLLLVGPVFVPRIYRPEPGQRMEAVRLRPEWCQGLLAADPGDHADALDDFTAVDPAGHDLLERLFATRSGVAALELLGAAVQARGQRLQRSPAARRVHRALEALRGSAGALRLGDLARDLGVTTRHLRRTVREHIGMTPRRFGRVERFLDLLVAADRCPAPRWVELAADHGYADQAHLIREARALTGCTPRTLHARRCAETG